MGIHDEIDRAQRAQERSKLLILGGLSIVAALLVFAIAALIFLS